MSLWVVVPAYNEAARITATLDALAAQTDRDFTLLVVDNNSLDRTTDVVRAFAGMPAQLIVEPHKGVGCAVDTGFRHAIAHGATLLARTDADCLPRPGWVAAARHALAGPAGGRVLDGGRVLVCGRVVARRDENGIAGRLGFGVAVVVAGWFGRLRPAPREPRYRSPHRMHAGNNMAITPAAYLASLGLYLLSIGVAWLFGRKRPVEAD
jgi:glycosyltransferase involved in cell wall biosynthesis